MLPQPRGSPMAASAAVFQRSDRRPLAVLCGAVSLLIASAALAQDAPSTAATPGSAECAAWAAQGVPATAATLEPRRGWQMERRDITATVTSASAVSAAQT